MIDQTQGEISKPAGPAIPASRLATAGGLLAILLWSTTVAVARSLAETVGPTSAGAAVYGVGGAAALMTLLRRGGPGRAIMRLPGRYLVICGGLFVGYMLLLYLAIGGADSRQQALEVGLLNYLWPALTIIFSLALLGNRAGWMLVPGTLLALAGIFMVFTEGGPITMASVMANIAANIAVNPQAYGLAAAAASYLTPFFSTLVSCWYLAVRPGTGLWVGCVLLVAGSLLSWLSVERGLSYKKGRPA